MSSGGGSKKPRSEYSGINHSETGYRAAPSSDKVLRDRHSSEDPYHPREEEDIEAQNQPDEIKEPLLTKSSSSSRGRLPSSDSEQNYYDTIDSRRSSYPVIINRKDSTHLSKLQTFVVVLSALMFFACVVLIIRSQDFSGFGGVAVGKPAWVIFSGLSQVILFCWCLYVNLKIWRAVGVEFEFTRNVSTPNSANIEFATQKAAAHRVKSTEMALLCSGASFILFVGVLLYLIIYDPFHSHAATRMRVAPVLLECVVFAVLFLFLISPWPCPGWARRRSFIFEFIKCVSCAIGFPPFGPVQFSHVLLTDGLTSGTLMIFQLEYAVCRFSTVKWFDALIINASNETDVDVCAGKHHFNEIYVKPILYALPLWLRVVQCLNFFIRDVRYGHGGWPRYAHLVNVGKYLASILVIVMSTLTDRGEIFFRLWIASLVIKTLYCFVWDTCMDWGLGSLKPGYGKFLLRKRHIFAPWVYYIALFTNLCGRVSWSIALSPHYCSNGCTFLFGFIEILRRGQWNVFRVEWEFTKKTEGMVSPLLVTGSSSQRGSSSSIPEE